MFKGRTFWSCYSSNFLFLKWSQPFCKWQQCEYVNLLWGECKENPICQNPNEYTSKDKYYNTWLLTSIIGNESWWIFLGIPASRKAPNTPVVKSSALTWRLMPEFKMSYITWLKKMLHGNDQRWWICCLLASGMHE